jgi:hypothetical protein
MPYVGGIKNFQNLCMICPKPHVAISICLRATIFQTPKWLYGHTVYQMNIIEDVNRIVRAINTVQRRPLLNSAINILVSCTGEFLDAQIGLSFSRKNLPMAFTPSFIA